MTHEGRYKEEYEAAFGIVVEQIKERTTPEFIIHYDMMRDGNDYTSLDAIEKDRVSIQIVWTDERRRGTEGFDFVAKYPFIR